MVAHPLEADDKYSQTSGVEEVHALHVDDEVVGAAGNQIKQSLTQLGSGGNVNLAADDQHGAVADRVGRKSQIHQWPIVGGICASAANR